ncbi:helix-turn-helix domain-containing protein [Chryseolinea soli]|uniref:AraC family transcriptional regulator n=1 Tax=Chryseolinea soli TaxID=2321403 RepID=A0A385SNW3_9BACT|nr:helix-turn-helix domain-containing protein [Chryseolinea soli]AYB32674.1 AraC family transcriptional regulator [Chryseolinea soli]
MKAQFILPPFAISRCVKNILVIEDANRPSDFILPLFANGAPTLVFQTVKASREGKPVGHLTLFGQFIAPSELVMKGDFTLIAYFFYPYALRSLFNVSGTDLTNEHADLNFFKAAADFSLQEKLLNAPALKDRLEAMTAFIQKRMECKTADDKKIVFATTEILKNNGLRQLPDIRRELNVSERTFQRLFELNVGVSPKMYRRICQFDAAFQALNLDPHAKLSDIAYQNGFADQSHFIRVFKEFTGLTPTQYLGQLSQYIP